MPISMHVHWYVLTCIYHWNGFLFGIGDHRFNTQCHGGVESRWGVLIEGLYCCIVPVDKRGRKLWKDPFVVRLQK